MKVIKMNVSTGWANGDHNDEIELPDDWEEYSKNDKDRYLSEVAVDYLHECCECSAWVGESSE